jgi:RNA polymerase sigma factor (sigma-70 family)
MSAWWLSSPLLFADGDIGDPNASRDSVHPHERRRGGGFSAPPEHTLSNEDAALSARIRTGDRTTVRVLFDKYFPVLLDHARAIMHDRDAAEDVVADVFVSILERPERVAPTRSLRAYLLWRVRHRALDVLRGERRTDARHAALAQQRDPAVIAAAPAPPDELVEAADAGDVRAHRMIQVLAGLSLTARTIVLLRIRDELDYDEIAIVLGISRAAVKMRLSRALGIIRSEVG